jgi:hypothetical protein
VAEPAAPEEPRSPAKKTTGRSSPLSAGGLRDAAGTPWLTQAEATGAGSAQEIGFEYAAKGVSKAGVALGSFTGRNDGLALDLPALATTTSRATALDGYIYVV